MTGIEQSLHTHVIIPTDTTKDYHYTSEGVSHISQPINHIYHKVDVLLSYTIVVHANQIQASTKETWDVHSLIANCSNLLHLSKSRTITTHHSPTTISHVFCRISELLLVRSQELPFVYVFFYTHGWIPSCSPYFMRINPLRLSIRVPCSLVECSFTIFFGLSHYLHFISRILQVKVETFLFFQRGCIING